MGSAGGGVAEPRDLGQVAWRHCTHHCLAQCIRLRDVQGRAIRQLQGRVHSETLERDDSRPSQWLGPWLLLG